MTASAHTRRTARNICLFGLGIGLLAIWFPLTAIVIGGLGGIFFSEGSRAR